jgi:polysaccharide pyruvyl transferase CsaB
MRAVLCGYYGEGNGGDEALLASVLQMLPQSVEPIVLSGQPQQTQQRYGVAAVPRFAARQVLATLRASDALIFGGGSLIQDVTSWKSPLYYIGLGLMARSLGLKVIAWAQGVGPLQHRLTQLLALSFFRSCTAVSVRDNDSAQILRRWGLDPLVAPDPVWALHASGSARSSAAGPPRIAVCLRPHHTLSKTRLATLGDALASLQRQTQAQLVFIPLHQIQDIPIAQQLQAQMPGPSEVIDLADPHQLLEVFHRMDLTISMRLHGLIMAAASGSRCFALSYDPKVSSLMRAVSMPGWEVAALPDSSLQLSTRWQQVLDRPNQLDSQRLEALKMDALQHRALLEQVLGY